MQTEPQGNPPEPIVPPVVVPAPAAAAPPVVEVDDTEVKVNGQVVTLPSNAFAKVKQKALEKGKKAAVAELAKQYGYDSPEKFLVALQKFKEPPPAQAPPPPRQEAKPPTQGKQPTMAKNNNEQPNRQLEKLQREKDELAKKAKLEASSKKRLQRIADSKDAEIALRDAAYKAGVKGTEIGIALHLLSEELRGKSEEELKAFDENKFLQDLKGQRPYLFGEVVRPATTGTGGNGAPAPLKPGDASQLTAQGSQIDARTMTREDYKKLVASRGFNLTA